MEDILLREEGTELSLSGNKKQIDMFAVYMNLIIISISVSGALIVHVISPAAQLSQLKTVWFMSYFILTLNWDFLRNRKRSNAYWRIGLSVALYSLLMGFTH